MGWGIALAVLTALALIPVGASLRYEEETFKIYIKVLGLSFFLPLGKKKPIPDKPPREEKPAGELQTALAERKQAKLDQKEAEKRQKEAEEKLRKAQEEKLQAQQALSEPQKKKKKPDLGAYLPFVRLGFDFLGSLRRKLRIEKLYAKVILAGDDPCDLAVNYGRAWAGASALMTQLCRLFVVEDQNLNIECDFLAEKTRISARADLTITIGRTIALAVGYGLRALKEFLIFKKRKGGAVL